MNDERNDILYKQLYISKREKGTINLRPIARNQERKYEMRKSELIAKEIEYLYLEENI